LARALAADRQPADALKAVETVLRLSPNDAEARSLSDSLRR
jgi:Flp pilus assembly protein TadD